MSRLHARRAAAITFATTVIVMFAGLVPAGAEASRPVLGAETHTPIRHFVTVMQEGHTFDNYFGSYPGAAGIPAGTCMPCHLRPTSMRQAVSRSAPALPRPRPEPARLRDCAGQVAR